MATEVPQDEIQSFYDFLGRRLENGGSTLTPEESVREFRAYQEELTRLRLTIATAREQAARGEAKPLDVDALIQRVKHRIASENAD